MNANELAVVLDYVGRDIMNMLALFDAEGSATEKEETMRYAAECLVYKLEKGNITTPEYREPVTLGMIELVKQLHKEGN